MSTRPTTGSTTGASRPRVLLALVPVLALAFALAGCGLPVNLPGNLGLAPKPLTAVAIFARAHTATYHDATFTLGGTFTTTLDGSASGAPGLGTSTSALTLNGTGQLVQHNAGTDQSASHFILNVRSTTTTAATGTASGLDTPALTMKLELITIGTTAYTRYTIQMPGITLPKSDLYTQSTVPAGSASASFTFTPQSAGKDLKLVGEDTINGVKCWHLTGTMSFAIPATTGRATTSQEQVKTDLWVRESDNRIERVKTGLLPGLSLSAPTAGSASNLAPGLSGASITGTLTVDFTRYDSGVTITAPPASQIKG